jgi:hemolysin activation/secretion protein
LSSEELLELVQDAYGQQVDLAGLNVLAERITAYCRSHGYPFAVALVPAQTLGGGEVTVQVVEGRYGQVNASGESSASAARWLSRLRPGAPIEHAPLERSLRVLGTLPGIEVNPVMQPGQAMGQGDLDVELQRQRFGGAVGLDNHGNRYTGSGHAGASVWGNSLLTFGDRLSLDALLTTETLWQGAVNYQRPLGTNGLRLRAGYAYTHYQLGKEFESLDATGYARVASTGLSYPLRLSAQGSVEVMLDYRHKWLHDEQAAVDSHADKSSNSARAALRFDHRDGWGGGGVSWGSLAWTHGQLNLDNALAAADAATARTQGHFDTFALDLSRLQRLAGPLNLYGRVAAQWAGQNLDSSERFGLGGAYGVRAYPEGEAYADEGVLLQTELRYRLGAFVPYGFYDAGWVRLNDTPWTNANNHRNLGGAGLGLRWSQARVSAEMSAAWRTRAGTPRSDTRDHTPQLWAKVQSRF